MFRLIVVLATLMVASECTDACAQGRSRSWTRGSHFGGSSFSHSRHNRYRDTGNYRPSSSATLFGFSFGTRPYGYDYRGYPDPYFLYPYSLDPWARGSFRAPDLLDDPYFYDRVPYNNRYRTPPIVRTQPPRSSLQLSRNGAPTNVDPGTPMMTDQSTMEVIEALQSASEKLLLSLASYGGGDAWIEYLGPDRIIEFALDGNTAKLDELLARYDGVLQNRELQVVSQIEGFAETRSQLRQYLRQPLRQDELPTEATMETLPAPAPEPPSALNDASEA